MLINNAKTPFSVRQFLDGYEGRFSCTLEHRPEYADPYSSDMSEAEIAACVQEWLAVYGWESYPEVALKHHAKRPDLIAIKGQWVHVIECKKALGLPVMEQAFSWFYSQHCEKAGLPHLITIAVRRNRSYRRSDFATELLKSKRVGLIEVDKTPARNLGHGDFAQNIPPSYELSVALDSGIVPGSRLLGSVLKEQVKPDTRIAVPGVPGGGGQYMTDWKRTMLKIEELMLDGETRSTSEIVAWLLHNGGFHWCSKSSAMSGVNSSLIRQKYGKKAYAHGNSHLWFWESGVTKPIINTVISASVKGMK